MLRTRKGRTRTLLAAAALVAAGLTGRLAAQGTQSSVLTGTVRATDGQALPGVSVAITSPALQGERTTLTEGNGSYILRGLPPGTYRVTFSLAGFSDLERTLSLGLGSTATADADLGIAAVAETVTVTADVAAPVTTSQVGANFTGRAIDNLPVNRTLDAIAELAPGLTNNTPSAGQVTISGAFAYDNVFMLDGVDINDNLFGDPNDLYIEDSIEETQVLTSGISAEYGRFSGGVINAVTKRGGNAFSGTLRTDLTNPSWTKETPFEADNDVTHRDDMNQTFSATLGGPLVKDRLWFFGAGRYRSATTTEQFDETGIAYDNQTTDKRFEIKLTGNLNPDHTLQAQWTRNRTSQHRPALDASIDPQTLIDPDTPMDLFVAKYSGVLSPKLFAEAQYSAKNFGFRNSGGISTNLVDSPFLTNGELPGVPAGLQYNAPYFDATDPEDRNNRQLTGSLSYFLATAGAGSHDLKAGFEQFSSIETGGNSQSSTGYDFRSDYAADASGQPLYDAAGRLIPVFLPFSSINVNWLATRGVEADIKTRSLYLNDRFSLGRHWFFNLGLRYERTKTDSTDGAPGIASSALVPRLAAGYDVTGDGGLRFDLTYAHYAGRYNQNLVGSGSSVANPAIVAGVYVGPEGQGLDFAPGFDLANYVPFFGSFPRENVSVDPDLASPITKEFTASVGGRLGSEGYLKAIYTRRKTTHFIDDFITFDNGSTTVEVDGEEFGPFDNIVYRNSDLPRRAYDGLQLQASYRLGEHWQVTGHYTVQLKNDGNYEGETGNRPGLPTVIGDYPEILVPERNFPTGRLDDFQRHKARVWTNYDVSLGRAGALNLGLLWRYDSALTYSLAAPEVDFSDVQLSRDPGYYSLDTQTLYYGPRGAGSYNGAHRFDAALNYEIPVYRSLRPWLKAELRNIFNDQTLIGFNTSITEDLDGPVDANGLPTQYVQGPRFGQGTSTLDYPLARSFRMSIGFRF